MGPELPLSVLTSALVLSLWVAIGSFVLAVADGLGALPGRRLAVGLVLVLATATALWQRQRVCASLWRQPWLVVGVAGAQLVVAGGDGFVNGPYIAFTLTSIGIAIVVAPARIVWSCVALLVLGYGAGVLTAYSPAVLAHHGDLAGVIGQALAYPFAALSLLGLAALFKRFVANAVPILEAIRNGAPTLTPALGDATAHRGRSQPLFAPGRTARIGLTASEIKVVEGLAAGMTPKQLAYEWGVSLATIRTHIQHTKRKTNARTLRQLAALAVHPDWPVVSIDEP